MKAPIVVAKSSRAPLHQPPAIHSSPTLPRIDLLSTAPALDQHGDQHGIDATSWVEVDLPAIAHNVRTLRQRCGRAKPVGLAAVVKADGYGHGAAAVAQAALDAGAERCCVFSTREAETLRRAGIHAPILVLGPIRPRDYDRAARLDLTLSVADIDTAQGLAQAARAAGRRTRVHLNIDSGLSRFGLRPADAPALAAQIRRCASLELEGVFTHFPSPTAADDRPTRDAFAAFMAAADQIGAPLRHAAASAAALRFPQMTLDFVRAGIALYGVAPDPTSAIALRPALSWHAELVARRHLRAGEAVSYGGRWRAPRDTTIGVLGVGYADGLRRALSGACVSINGRRAPIVGAICMDAAMIDLGPQASDRVGDIATLIGAEDDLTASARAERLGTTPYEVLTAIGPRVARVYRSDQPDRASACLGARAFVGSPAEAPA